MKQESPQNLRILWLKTGPLHPLDTGGKIRTYNMLRELSRQHEVTYLSLLPEGTLDKNIKSSSEYSQKQIWIPWKETPKRSPQFFSELAGNFLFSPLPYVIQKYKSAAMSGKIAELDRSGSQDLIICDFLTPSVNLFAPNQTLKTKTVLFQHNVESLIWKRLFDRASNPVKRAYFHGQWQRMQRYEKEACERCDGVVGVSEEDCQLMKAELGLKNVLGAVPTGVDVSYFASVKPERKSRSVVFLGSMDWMPNIDAVNYFVSEVFPLVKEKFPEVAFTIVGRNPPPAIKDLSHRNPAVRVTGTVDDVRPYLAEAAVMVVPLRIGGGTRIKIYEGMAGGIPIVSTSIGAEGLPLKHGEHILLADSPVNFAQEIINLLNQTDLRERIGKSGLALVQERFSWESATRIFEDYCQSVCLGRKE